MGSRLCGRLPFFFARRRPAACGGLRRALFDARIPRPSARQKAFGLRASAIDFRPQSIK
ncbi:hypothetical protein OM513_00055 [Sphingomonas canadensis]|nr:hypothetical protein [Sphingomonas canadensis]